MGASPFTIRAYAGSLVPGQLVTARVRHVLSDGLICSFLTYFT